MIRPEALRRCTGGFSPRMRSLTPMPPGKCRLVQNALDHRATLAAAEAAGPPTRTQLSRNRRPPDKALRHRRQGCRRHASTSSGAKCARIRARHHCLCSRRIGCARQPQLAARRQNIAPEKPVSQRKFPWAAWIIAKLGGWDGYPSSKPPGPITFKHGLQEFHATVAGWKLKNVCMLAASGGGKGGGLAQAAPLSRSSASPILRASHLGLLALLALAVQRLPRAPAG